MPKDRKSGHTAAMTRKLERERRPERIKRIYLAEFPTDKFIYCTDPKCKMKCSQQARKGLLKRICIKEGIGFTLTKPKGDILDELEEKGVWVLDLFTTKKDVEKYKKRWKKDRNIKIFRRRVTFMKSMLGDLRKLEPGCIITAFKHHPTAKQWENPKSWTFWKATWEALKTDDLKKLITFVFDSPWPSRN